MSYEFHVIDTSTSQEPDLEQIAMHEDWATDLVWCKMDGFAIREDGELLLLDRCGNYRFCPQGRFTVILEEHSTRPIKPEPINKLEK